MKYLNHAILMFTAWAVFGLMLACTNRWCRHRSDWSQTIHAVFGFILLILSLAGLFILIDKGGLEIEDNHSILGITVTIGSILVSLNGMFTLYAKKNIKWNTKFISLPRNFHKYFGFLLLVTSTFTIGTGIFELVEEN